MTPDQGNRFTFSGNTVTSKFSSNGQNRMDEFVGTASSGTPPLHTHPWDEWYYFLAGEIDFQVGDSIVLATPGYVVNLPAGVAHTFKIKSSQAKFLVWVSNAAAERYLIELAEASQTKDLTPIDVMAIGQKHHIRLVP